MRWSKNSRRKLYCLVRDTNLNLVDLGVRRVSRSPSDQEKDPKFITIPDPKSKRRPSDTILVAHYIEKAREERKKWTKKQLADRIMDECGVAVTKSLITTCGSYILPKQSARAAKKIKIPRLKIPKDIALKILILGIT